MRTRGFTLIELMLVVAIIGLLSAIAIPKMADLIDKSREAAMKANLGTLRSALELYYADNEGVYPRFNQMTSNPAGLITLDGKYLDFSTVVFRIPRYAGNYAVITAAQHFAFGLPAISSNSDRNGPFADPDPLPYIHMMSAYPSYYVWAPNSLGTSMGTVAHIGAHPVNVSTFQELLDLRGVAWSLW